MIQRESGTTVNTSIAEYLAEHEKLVYRISGVSMKPMLRQNKDLVVIRRYDGKGLHKHDVAMYDRGGSRRYVLHRVVEVYDGYYTFLGDNCISKEKNIPEGSIVAVLDSFIRNGKIISLDHPLYKFYVIVHCRMYPVRKVFLWLRYRASRVPFLKKIYRSILRKKLM